MLQMSAPVLAQVLDSINLAVTSVIKRTMGPKRELLEQDREDIVQTTLVRVINGYDESKATEMARQAKVNKIHAKYGFNMNNRRKWQNASPIAAYAWQIGRNVAIDFLRCKGPARTYANHLSLESPVTDDDDMLDLGEILPAREPSAFDQMWRVQRDEWLVDEVNTLPEKQRTALLSVMADDDTKKSGAFRLNKMRAIDKIVANLPKRLRGNGVRSKNKGRSRKAA